MCANRKSHKSSELELERRAVLTLLLAALNSELILMLGAKIMRSPGSNGIYIHIYCSFVSTAACVPVVHDG